MILLLLIWEFSKIGLFAVGGGLATLPFLYELSARTAWFTGTDIANMIAISEATPGPLGINMSTYVGYTTAGIPGAVLASLGLVLPSLIIVLVVAKMLKRFKESRLLTDIFYGLRPASVALVTAAGIEVLKISLLSLEKWVGAFSLENLLGVVNWPCVGLAAVLLLLTRKLKKAHPVFFIAGSAGAGILFGVLGLI